MAFLVSLPPAPAMTGTLPLHSSTHVFTIVACSSSSRVTGESVTLDDDEHATIVKTCVEECKGKVPVIAGAGGNDTRKAIAKHKKIASLGVDGSLQVTPY